MTFEVELHAFRDPKDINDIVQIRTVEVPDNEILALSDGSARAGRMLLDRIWYYGQNDFQPQKMRSVSMGDIIRIPDKNLFSGQVITTIRIFITATGFEKVDADFQPTFMQCIHGSL